MASEGAPLESPQRVSEKTPQAGLSRGARAAGRTTTRSRFVAIVRRIWRTTSAGQMFGVLVLLIVLRLTPTF